MFAVLELNSLMFSFALTPDYSLTNVILFAQFVKSFVFCVALKLIFRKMFPDTCWSKSVVFNVRLYQFFHCFYLPKEIEKRLQHQKQKYLFFVTIHSLINIICCLDWFW